MQSITFTMDKKFMEQALPLLKEKAIEQKITVAAQVRSLIINRLHILEKSHTQIILAANARQEIEWAKKHNKSLMITMEDGLYNILIQSTNDRHELDKVIRQIVYDALDVE